MALYQNESANGPSSELVNTLTNDSHPTYQSEENKNNNENQQPTSHRQPQNTLAQNSSYIQRPSFGLADFMLLETLGKLSKEFLIPLI